MTTKYQTTTEERLSEKIADFVSDPFFAAPTVVANAKQQNAYYRSKTFSVNGGINPLADAAAPIFAIVNKLKNSTAALDLIQLFYDLTHEVKAFEQRAQIQGYRANTILAARYVLCALLDETILTTEWGKSSEWLRQNLISSLHVETDRNEKFFIILERSCQDPATHIDLLELLYFCLSLGFAGKYRDINNGHEYIGKISDELYQVIQQQRGEFPKYLTLEQPVKQRKTKTKLKPKLWPIVLTTFLTVIIMFFMYFSFDHALNNSMTTLNQILNQLQNPSINHEVKG